MKRRIDYFLKGQIIECGLAKLQSKFSKFIFLFNKCYDDEKATYKDMSNEASLEYLDAQIKATYDEALKRFGVDLSNALDPYTKEALKINHASYERVKRLKYKVAQMLEKPCVFLTLTFNDSALHGTSIETKRKYVTRCLKAFNAPYIANIDYGKQNGRLHYHALLQVPKIAFDTWDYGNIDAKKVVVINETAIAKYISKLTNHAIKETCKGNRLIYSRKV